MGGGGGGGGCGGGGGGAKFLKKGKLQSNNTTFAWLKFFNLKLFNITYLNKISINIFLNTQN